MSYPTPEVTRLGEQAERTYNVLLDLGISADLIVNPNDEPLAVVARDMFDPAEVVETPELVAAFAAPTRDNELIDRARQALPLSGSRIYPPNFLELLDVITQTCADQDTPGGLVTRLNSPTSPDIAFKEPVDFAVHADFIGSTNYLDKKLPLHGINVHATRWGSALVRLGALRSLDTEQEIAQAMVLRDEGLTTQEMVTDLYERLAAPFTEPFTLNPGDVLVFQAEHHTERGFPAIAHLFQTSSDSRRSDVFKPHWGETDVVQHERDALIGLLGLEALGYMPNDFDDFDIDALAGL